MGPVSQGIKNEEEYISLAFSIFATFTKMNDEQESEIVRHDSRCRGQSDQDCFVSRTEQWKEVLGRQLGQQVTLNF
jgi:hypothetical protein